MREWRRYPRECVLARQHDPRDADLLHQARARGVVHGELRRAVDLEARIDPLDEANRAEVLHQHRIDAAIHAGAEVEQRIPQLGWLEEHVESEIDARTARVREAAGVPEVVERQLRPVVARIEPFDAEIDRIGTIRDGGPDCVERPGG